MPVNKEKNRGPKGPLEKLSKGIGINILVLLGLVILDGLGIFILNVLLRDGAWTIAAPIFAILLVINVVSLNPKMFPIKWQIPVVSIIILIVIFPIVYTVYSAFTNYSDGHILTKPQSIKRLSQYTYLPEGGRLTAGQPIAAPKANSSFGLSGQMGKPF